MRFVSLFAGVGGFDLGLEASGHTCIGQVEIDKHARKVLERHFPDVPKHDDVTTAIDWAVENGLVGCTDLVVGGFPCQDLSVAGKRAGLAGERSGLFHDALAFAKSVEAKTIILENVPGLLSSNQGRDFGTVLTELANAGYSNIEWRVLDSQFFGVAQRRHRQCHPMDRGKAVIMTDKPDLAIVLEHYGSTIPDKSGYISIRCVLHDDTQASATVNIDKQRYHCFVCQFDGDVYDVVATKEGIGFKDAISRAEVIADGNRRQVRRTSGSGNSLLPARSRNSKGSRRYIPPRNSS